MEKSFQLVWTAAQPLPSISPSIHFCVLNRGSNIQSLGRIGQYFSSFDQGNSLQEILSDGSIEMSSATCSETGQYIAGISTDGHLQMSTDFGMSWHSNPPITNKFTSTSISSDGGQIVAYECHQDESLESPAGYFHLSSNYGSSFSSTESAFDDSACSGKISVDFFNNTYFYSGTTVSVSADFGLNWREMRSLPSESNWQQVSFDRSGQHGLALSPLTGVVHSQDAGTVWHNSNVGTNTPLWGEYMSFSADSSGSINYCFIESLLNF